MPSRLARMRIFDGALTATELAALEPSYPRATNDRRANLAVSAVETPAAVTLDESFEVRYRVTNLGTIPAIGPWYDTISIAAGPAAGATGGEELALGSFSFYDTIAPGETVLITNLVYISSFGPAGDFSVRVHVDQADGIAESSETDNHAVAPQPVRIPAILNFSTTEYFGIREDVAGGVFDLPIYRNGDASAPLIVNLTSSDTTELRVPVSVEIPAGSTIALIRATIIRDRENDGPQVVRVTASAPGRRSAEVKINVEDADSPPLLVTLNPARIREGESAEATLRRSGVNTPAVFVSFNYHGGQLELPAGFTLPAGTNEFRFTVTAVDDSLPEGNHSYTITASAPGYLPGESTVTIEDNDVPELRLGIVPAEVLESAGPQGARGRILRDRGGPRDLTIALRSGDPTAVRVPAEVILPAGETTAYFDIGLVDNARADGSRQVALGGRIIDTATGTVVTEIPPTLLTVLDDEGAHLVLGFGADLVPSGLSPATTATITRRGTNLAANLTVRLTADLPARLTIPATITIPAGQDSISFALGTPAPAGPPGPVTVSITAEATGLTRAMRSLTVAGAAAPDLALPLLEAPASVAAGQTIRATLRIANTGFAPGGKGARQQFYWSNDAFHDPADSPAGDVTLDASITPGDVVSQSVQFRAPAELGEYWIIAVADADGAIDELREDNNIRVSATSIAVIPGYGAIVRAGIESAIPGTPIPLTGTATRIGGSEPAAFVPVEIAIRLRDTERRLSVMTDARGAFATVFEPLPGEAGQYSIAALHPGSPYTAPQAHFKLLGLRLEPIDRLRLTEGTSLTVTSLVANLVDLPFTGLRLTAVSAPRGITVTGSLTTDRIAADGTVGFGLAITAAFGAENGEARIQVLSGEGAAGDRLVPISVSLAQPRLVATPSPLEAGMRRGDQSVVYVGVTNVGGLPTGPLTILAPPAPWLKVASPARLPALVPGQGTQIALLLAPAEDLPLGPYTGSLVVSATNAGVAIPFAFLNLSERIGGLALEAVDEFTYYAAGAPKLTNATVTVFNATSKDLVATNLTDARGTALFPELREGFYELEVTADDHTPYRGTVLVQPGRTNVVTAFLSRQTVRYVFSVVLTEIEDRTRIEITTVFETFVPIPVLTVNPPYFDLGAWSGVVTQVNVTLENHGLIAANNVRFALPEHPDITFSSVISHVGTLPARTAIQIPIVIRRNGASQSALADARLGGPALAPLVGGGGAYALQPALRRSSPGAGSHRALMTGDRRLSAGSGPCFADMSFSFDLECVPQVNTYDIPLRFDQLPGDCSGPSGWYEPWSVSGVGGPGGDGSYGTGSGGCDGCYGEPQLFTPPRILSPPKNCDPCLAGIGAAIVSCVGELGPKKAAAVGKCLFETAKCLGGLAKAVNYGSLAGCAGNVGSCVGGAVGGLLKAPKCIEPAAPCLSGGGGGGGTGGSGAALHGLHSARQPASTGADFQIPAAAEPFLRQQRRAVALVEPFLYWLGDDAWLDVTDEAAWSQWFDAFNASTPAGSDGAERISAAERARLLLIPPPAPLTTETIGRFLDRWNRSLDAWARGFFNASQLPAGENQDIISVDQISKLALTAVSANDESIREGYADALSAQFLAGEEFIARADSSGGGVCARVKIKIEQEAVITRDGFNATLEIFNDTDLPLVDIGVELNMRSAAGEDSTRNFGLRPPVLTGLTSVGGTGQIAPRSTGRSSWILIPTSDAAPDGPVTHLVGGTLRYRQGDLVVTVPLAASGIRVLPNAALTLKYFHERDVLADDPFTDEIEPSVPYSLAVMIANSGKGVARNVRISSAQPRIVENKKGLLVDFKIIATEVAGEPVTPSLTANFGDVPPGEIRIGRWLLQSTLQGLFTEYSATFEHLDGLGDKRLSLIQGVEIHELIRVVQADLASGDHRPDFLANDIPDFDDLPDTLHLSQGTVQPVLLASNATVNATPALATPVVQLTATFPARWGYLRIPDPSGGNLRLREVRRPDGTLVSLGTNVWVTDRTFVGLARKPILEYVLHLLDFASPGTYQLTYAAPAPTDSTPPASRVLPLADPSPVDIQVRWEGSDPAGSGIASYDIFVAEDNAAFTPWLQGTVESGALYPGQAGRKYAFFAVATDLSGNRELPPAAPDAATTAGLPNTAPVISPQPELILDEGDTATLRFRATDTDVPANQLSWSLGSGAPAGVRLDPQTGSLSWSTGEGNGPGTNRFTVLVRDSGSPSLTTTSQVSIIVREVNSPPTLEAITNRVVNELRPVVFQSVATDPDLPRNSLRFSLQTPPAGAAISIDGRFTWTPSRLQGPSTNLIRVLVTDDGAPARSATHDFTVVVRDTEGDFDLQIGSLVTPFPPDPTVPIRLNSGLDLVSISFVLEVRSRDALELLLEPVAPELATAQVAPAGGNRFTVQLVAAPGELLQGNRILAEFRFRTAELKRSSLIHLQPTQISGVRSGGERVPTGRGLGGRIVLLGLEPVLEADATNPGRLQLHSQPDTTYRLESTTDLGLGTPQSWQSQGDFRPTATSEFITIPAGPTPFYRVRK